ncbi:MAG: hypothetical protein KUG77_02015 [Nannocystaceae bacterium]|nr:hypothetical protein [Nannocystaceae bacterium]
MRQILSLSFLLSTLGACAASAPMATAPAAARPDMAPASASAPVLLQESHFARTAQGTLSEADLQKILDQPLELDLPGRVGVLPIVEAEDWRGPSPSYDRVTPGLSRFADKLPADDGFAQVTEMMPIPSGALGMEALREVAARYKLRYLLLYREHVNESQRANGVATGYLSVVGAFVLPGSTLEVAGYAEASLFDVKTGLLLFTVRERLSDERRSNVWQRERKLGDMREALATKAADQLAKRTRVALEELRLTLAAPTTLPAEAPQPTESTVVGAGQ